MFIIYTILLFMNTLTEYLFNKMMFSLNVIEKKNIVFHVISALLRILWIFFSAWLVLPLPLVIIILFILLAINIIPYHHRSLMMNNFTMIIYLIYITILMLLVSGIGLIGIDIMRLIQDPMIRVVMFNINFIIFNLICFLLLRYHSKFLWDDDYDRLKVILYTRFLFICSVYQIFDSIMITFYEVSQINYLLLVSGNILILILMYNFLNYNYVFAKSEMMKKEYEEKEVLIAQQYFEKETLKKLSEYDSLTDTYNRREISTILFDGIQKGQKLTCVFIDLDGLKRVNDKYGHTYGDIMLKRFANACMEILGNDGKLARIGGDEFLLVYFNQSVEVIEKKIKELQLKLLEPEIEKDKIYFSYGISCGEDTVENYIILADKRMYEYKNRKRQGGV